VKQQYIQELRNKQSMMLKIDNTLDKSTTTITIECKMKLSHYNSVQQVFRFKK